MQELFDAVAMLQVVDLLEDIRRGFAQVRTPTKTGGWWPIEFGDRPSITARVLATGFSCCALRRLLADDRFALRAGGCSGKLRAGLAVSLLRYKAGWPTVRTGSGAWPREARRVRNCAIRAAM
jgi:hypothetical protein